MHRRTCLTLIFTVLSFFLFGQSPTDQLNVEGIIHAGEGGFRFPDSTLQTTAAFNQEVYEEAATRGKAYFSITGMNPKSALLAISQIGMDVLIDEQGGQQTNFNHSRINLKFQKEVDRTTPVLFGHMAGQDLIPEIRIEFTDASNMVYHSWTLEGVYINNQTVKNVYTGNGNYVNIEEVELQFHKQTVIFHGTSSTGSCACFNYMSTPGECSDGCEILPIEPLELDPK